jgi:hypothetical protein
VRTSSPGHTLSNHAYPAGKEPSGMMCEGGGREEAEGERECELELECHPTYFFHPSHHIFLSLSYCLSSAPLHLHSS